MEETRQKRNIILASESPRRKRLLQDALIKFSVVPSLIDEALVNEAGPVRHARSLAQAKAEAVSINYPDDWVIGADSIVAIDDEILNKPLSEKDAYTMLSKLSGRTHRVVTGYSIVCRSLNHLHSDACITQVTFKDLSDKEIRWYLQTPEPWDKAGAYAIQKTAAFMVRHIQGSYTNVVGLPVCEVLDHLLKAGAIDRNTEINQINGRVRSTKSK